MKEHILESARACGLWGGRESHWAMERGTEELTWRAGEDWDQQDLIV